MQLLDAAFTRRMTRDFSDEEVALPELDTLLAAANRAPSAGLSEGVDLLVLSSAVRRERFWQLLGDEAWLADETRSAPLRRAPLVLLPVADPSAYLDRYGAPDKAASSLSGLSLGEWPVAYWTVDAAFAVMTLLLGAEVLGLGALFFHLHGREETLIDGLGLPPGRVLIGAVALGHRRGGGAPPTSLTRRRRGLDEVVHRDEW